MYHAVLMVATWMPTGDLSKVQDVGQIIAAMRENEKLYRNIECVYRRDYCWPMPEAIKGWTVHLWDEVRVVFQNGLYYANFRSASLDPDGSVEVRDSEYGYDGKYTRVNEQGIVGNIWHEWHRPGYWLTPTHVGFPEAVSYAVSDQLAKTPEVQERYPLPQECAVVGTETVDGLDCHKLLVKVFSDDPQRKLVLHYFLWVAPARNYMVVRTERWQHITEDDCSPWFVYEAKDWRELAPGVWAPFMGLVTQYWAEDLKRGVAAVEMRAVTVFEKVELNPQYGISLFRNIEMPKSGTVWTVKGGKATATRVPVDEPRATVAPDFAITDGRNGSWKLVAGLLAATAAVICVTLVTLQVRRRSRSTKH